MVDPEVCQGITTDEVKAAHCNINLTNAAGPGKIHPRFPHHSEPVSISLLTSILNKSHAETKFPQEWSVANIRPIPKGGKDVQKMERYRPISYTSTVGKTMGRLVTNRPRYFAEVMHLLTEYQAGLRHGHSTEDQLLQLSQSISYGFQQSPM